MINERLPLDDDPVGLILGVAVIGDRDSLFEILLKFLLSHITKLLGIVYGIFNFSDLFKDSLFVGLQCVFLA